MSEDVGNLNRVEDLLEQILAWTRVGMYAAAKEALSAEFREAPRGARLAYELLDGKRTQKDVLELCGKKFNDPKVFSKSTLSNWVGKWERLGLIKKEGQPKKLFSLEDFNLAEPLEKT